MCECVLGGDEHPVVGGVPVGDDLGHLTVVLGTVVLVEEYLPARDDGLLDVVVDTNLGLSGGVEDVLGLAGAEGLVVLLVAIVEGAVGVEALAGGDASAVTGTTVGDEVHVGGFGDFGGHLFGGHEGEDAGGDLHVGWYARLEK